MNSLRFGRDALGVCVAAALLSACNGSAPLAGVPNGVSTGVTPGNGNPGVAAHQRTFRYIGREQTFKVPAGVTRVTVIAIGASGGPQYGSTTSAHGGRVFALLPVHAGEPLYVYVGGPPDSAKGGFNGGADAGGGFSGDGSGGGGASDIREGGKTLGDRIVVSGGAGGQGGAGYSTSGAGGKGGGEVGAPGANGGLQYSDYAYGGGGGSGGTQSAGGTGGSNGEGSAGYGEPGDSGSRGRGGAGGAQGDYGGAPGGGGGGGYYGGGGGGSGGVSGGSAGPGAGGGGGGGSSYVGRSVIRYRFWQGWKQGPSDGSGLVVFSW